MTQDNILTPEERQALKGMARYWTEVFGRDNQEVLAQECQQVYSVLGYRLLSIIMFYLKETREQ